MAADWAAPDAVVKRMTWAQSFAAVYAPQTPPPDEANAVLGARLTEQNPDHRQPRREPARGFRHPTHVPGVSTPMIRLL